MQRAPGGLAVLDSMGCNRGKVADAGSILTVRLGEKAAPHRVLKVPAPNTQRWE